MSAQSGQLQDSLISAGDGNRPSPSRQTRSMTQSFAPGRMRRRGLGGSPRRVGGKKRERSLIVLPVFGKVEMHASDQVPGRMTALEELLDRKPGLSELGIESPVQVAPQIGQDRRRQIFGAIHRR